MRHDFQKGLSWLEVIVLIFLLLILAGVIFPPTILRAAKAGARTEALNNAKAIAGGLVSFKTDFGAYPCGFTRKILEEQKGISHLPKGTHANAYLAQLVATDFIDDEAVFHAAKTFSHKGNNLKNSAETLLAPGENGFAYVMAPNEEPLTDVSSMTPLVLAPILEGGDKPVFDQKAYADKGVYGAVDGSGKVFSLDEDGHAVSKIRDDFFASGPDTLFGSDTPIIKLPNGHKPPPLEFPPPSEGPQRPRWVFFIVMATFVIGLWWLVSGAIKAACQTTPEDDNSSHQA